MGIEIQSAILTLRMYTDLHEIHSCPMDSVSAVWIIRKYKMGLYGFCLCFQTFIQKLNIEIILEE